MAVGDVIAGAALSQPVAIIGGSSNRPLRIRNEDDDAGDLVAFDFQLLDSAGNADNYAQLRGVIIDPTSASEDGSLEVFTTVAGTQTRVGTFTDSGFVVGDTALTNSSVGLEIDSTTRAFLLPRMTTVQRDLLTAVNGMVIYNSTTGTVQAYVAGAWASL